MAGISEGEVAVYDRQLRLWGVQAQQRLLQAKVLVWGMEGSNVEVCKNLVLAGVSLVIRDHRPVVHSDVAFNYFLREDDLGKNCAECAAARVQEMNPLCAVSFDTAAPSSNTEKLQEAIKGCNVVCVSLSVLGWDVERAKLLDEACRDSGVGFMLLLSAGELAFFFADLNMHIVQERSGAQGGAGSTAQTQSFEPETVSYPSFGDWLELAPANLQQKKVDASFLLFSLAMAFLRSGGSASPEAAAEFEAFCRKAGCEPKVDGYENSGLQSAFKHLFLQPLMHVASVLGGLLAQEVIKAITKRDLPLVNSVCFNANTCSALVERLPAAPLAKKRKAEDEVAADLLD